MGRPLFLLVDDDKNKDPKEAWKEQEQPWEAMRRIDLIVWIDTRIPHTCRVIFPLGNAPCWAFAAESDILQKIDWSRTAEQIEHYVKELGLLGCGEVLPTRFTSESAPERVAKELRR